MSAAGRIPNLVLAGVTKCGTTSLVRYLAQHPDIGVLPRKGPDHFTPLRYGPTELPPASAYAAHFVGISERYALDGSITYFTGGSRLTTALSATLGPNAEILLILRDPTARLWSSYKMKRTRSTLPASITGIEGYVARSLDLYERGLDTLPENRSFASLRTGRYSEHLPFWFDAFGSHVNVLFFDDLASDPRRLLESLCRRLGLDTNPVARFDLSIANRTVVHRHAGMRHAAERLRRGAWRALKTSPRLESGLRSLYRSLNTREFSEVLPTETRQLLDDFYRPSNVAAAALLRDRGLSRLPSWLAGAPATPAPQVGLDAIAEVRQP